MASIDRAKQHFHHIIGITALTLMIMSVNVTASIICPTLTCAFDFDNSTCYIHSGDNPVSTI